MTTALQHLLNICYSFLRTYPEFSDKQAIRSVATLCQVVNAKITIISENINKLSNKRGIAEYEGENKLLM